MVTLGVSVYPDVSSMDDIAKYLQLASSYGFTRVFSSMFSVEGSAEEVLEYFKTLIDIAHKHSMTVSLDVNPACFKKFGASIDDLSVFKDINVDILRMDISYGEEGDLKLVQNPHNILIEFNASFMDPSMIQQLVNQGANPDNILVCHNFYPQKYTAMKWQKFLDVNASLKAIGVRVGAFISSNAKDTHGVWDAKDGLPTVERLRGLPIDLQFRMMEATNDVDDILIGNAFASEEEFMAIQEVIQVSKMTDDNPMKKILSSFGASDHLSNFEKNQRKLKVELVDDITDVEKEILFNFFPHHDVGDSSEWIWRSRLPRFLYKDTPIPQRKVEKPMFERGDVVMVNETYRNYAGEVQIVLIPIENDGQRNLIATFDDQECLLLELIQDRDTIVFIEKEGDKE